MRPTRIIANITGRVAAMRDHEDIDKDYMDKFIAKSVSEIEEYAQEKVNDAVSELKSGISHNISNWISYPLMLIGLTLLITLFLIHAFGGHFEYSVEHGAIENIRTFLSSC